ncbi:DUF551 domain-containing protein [Moraxella bovis]|nr:DUF551 domain-containing protein [Moraxella bovis]UYZ74092.1 DUF551 domain-containing protein [Moraxella bovis]UYZ99541.1 DUF551 domain-containing protein [Moraxella bovis]STY90172.1 Protein of uncharacterised function (DUF551) [Moraxella bovis]
MNSLDIIKQHIIKTLTFYNLSRKNKSLRAELGKIHSLADKLSENNSWISVDDELPPDFESVLTLSIMNTYQILSLQKNGEYFDFARKETVRVDYITHWQPLPQPPKE